MIPNLQIAVLGGRVESEDILKAAEEVGRLIAERGAVLVCGGMGGVMEAACKGAKSADGLTVGILPVTDAKLGNAYLDVIIPTGMGDARNAMILNSVQGAIAVGGKYGTLSEIAYALQRNLPVVSLKSWDVDPSVYQARTAREAVEYIFTQIEAKA